MRYFLFIIFLFITGITRAGIKTDSIFSFKTGDVKITIDAPSMKKSKKIILILYALPNGNTTEETMGKKMKEGDDWHFDIQHIRAQTKFVRKRLSNDNIVVVYLENSFKSWPAWKAKHSADYIILTQQIVDTLYNLMPPKRTVVYLNSHSGGGRFIFDYLDGVKTIPSFVKRISFLDSDYGYDSSYLFKLKTWLDSDKSNYLTVFAYNDSVALYKGKTFVSATGGTWYRTHVMLNDLSSFFKFYKTEDDSLIVFKSKNNRIQFFLKTNPSKIIYHTTQVELNGFIHSVLAGTKYDSKGYKYFGKRAYSDLIEE